MDLQIFHVTSQVNENEEDVFVPIAYAFHYSELFNSN